MPHFYMGGSKYARTYKSKYGNRHFVIHKREKELHELYDGKKITKEKLQELEREESYQGTKKIRGFPSMYKIEFYTTYLIVTLEEDKEADSDDI
jgi:hypothetical protein